MAQTNPWTETVLIRWVELGDRENVCVSKIMTGKERGEREWKREIERETERGPLM